MERAYLSEVSAWWSMERQEAALADVLPGARVYRDTLDRRQRRAKRPSDLTQRAVMLRPTSRSAAGDVLHVASLAVLAWDEADFRAVVTALAARGIALAEAEQGWRSTSNVEDAVAGWREARQRARMGAMGQMGGRVSAEKRKAASAEGIARIADLWPLPTAQHSTASLLALAGLSLNTVKAHLGPRPIAQYLAGKRKGSSK